MDESDGSRPRSRPIAERAIAILERAGMQTRKETLWTPSLVEIDTWARPAELERAAPELVGLGFTPFRPRRTRAHRFFLSFVEGTWLKVDVKLVETGSTSFFRDLAWLAVRRRGVTVALLGADGAGKSTASRCIEDTMPVDVKVAYLGRRRRGNVASGDSRGIDDRSPRREPSPARLLGGTVRWIVTTGWRVWRVQLLARMGSVVVCDRHPIEAGHLGNEPRAVRAVKRLSVAMLMPSPDIVILLDAPGVELHRRKGEHDPARLDSMTKKWREVTERAHGSVIDATASPDEVCTRIQAEIWAVLSERRIG